ncbi:hypothetical protein F4808DRAFT_51975 [Astrocystis sublimbata]|nr:hypothetical protein F4808DRAFT_51975 [Astrocystis sublimbata]
MAPVPEVSRDSFVFTGDLYVETGGQNRHRRAAVKVIQEHFKSGSEKDHPAHWFEAQLIHYGLAPSKTKSVARMRLFDAVNSGKLAVPAHIKRLEADLKKEWTKNEREAEMKKKKGAAKTSTASATTAGRKRKAEVSNVDMTINVGGIKISFSANDATASSSAVKKSKLSTTASKSKPATPAKKQTARRPATGPSRASTSTAGSPAVRARQLTHVASRRRSSASAASGPNYQFEFDGPPPPYSEVDPSRRRDGCQ